MGFLNNSTNSIIVDAVLTDLGREAMARQDGSFSIFKFAFSDQEIDYGHIVTFGRTVGKEKIEKNTPIFEASTDSTLAQKYKTVSINNSALFRLPTLILSTPALVGGVLSLGRFGAFTGLDRSSRLTFKQSMASANPIDPDLTDFSYRVQINHLFLGISGLVPDNVNVDNVATYTIPANPTIDANNLSALSINVFAKAVSDETFNVFRQKLNPVVETLLTASGQNSGQSVILRIQIT